MKKLAIALTGLTFFQFGLAQTQQTTAPQSYDLEAIYQLAAENNATYLAAQSTFDAAREAAPIAFGSLLPSINTGYDIGYTKNTGSSERETLNQTIGLTANQTLFNWSIWEVFSQSQYQVKADTIAFAQAQQDLVLNTAQVYFNVLQAQENLEYANANEKWNKELLTQTEQKFQSGLATQTDVQTIKAQYQTSVAQKVQAQSNLVTAFAQLEKLTGKNIAAIDNLKDGFPFDNPNPNNVDNWLQTAMKQNLAIIRSKYIQQAADAGVGITVGNFLPNANLSASISRLYNKNYNASSSSNGNSSSIGATANWNLLRGGSDYATYKQSKFLNDAAKFGVLEAERAVQADINITFNQVVTDVLLVQAYHQAVIAAQASVDDMKAGYEVGTQTIVDLLQQQQILFQAQQDYADAKFRYINDLLLLKQVAGNLVYQDIEMINPWLSNTALTDEPTAEQQQPTIPTSQNA